MARGGRVGVVGVGGRFRATAKQAINIGNRLSFPARSRPARPQQPPHQTTDATAGGRRVRTDRSWPGRGWTPW